MRTVHLDCPSGIAGDMLLAALIDLGASLEYIRSGIDSLDLAEPWTLEVLQTQKNGMTALRAEVRVAGVLTDSEEQTSSVVEHSGGDHHDHSHADHVHEHEHHHGDHGHRHHHEHHHAHEHQHEHGDHDHHHSHDHVHRPYREIKALLDASHLPERVRARAHSVFWELAQAEGNVHGVDPDEVHFHEVGSTDAIIDIVGCCLALESLDVERLTASELHVGKGFVRAAHGRMPIPAPATLKLLEGLSFYQTDIRGELVTPTGAALVRALCDQVGPMNHRRIERVGCGAGRRDLPIPNILRALLSEDEVEAARPEWLHDEVVEIEANIDDMSSEVFTYLFERLFEEGARDVWVVPATMKKSRPGHVLHVLAAPPDEARIAGILFEETTTLGVRVRAAYRWMLERGWIEVMVEEQPIRVKIGKHRERILNLAPEYDDSARAALKLGRPLKLVTESAREQASRRLQTP